MDHARATAKATVTNRPRRPPAGPTTPPGARPDTASAGGSARRRAADRLRTPGPLRRRGQGRRPFRLPPRRDPRCRPRGSAARRAVGRVCARCLLPRFPARDGVRGRGGPRRRLGAPAPRHRGRRIPLRRPGQRHLHAAPGRGGERARARDHRTSACGGPVGRTPSTRGTSSGRWPAISPGACRLEKVGPRVHDPLRLPLPPLRRVAPDEWAASVLHVDRFGNLTTTLTEPQLAEVIAGRRAAIPTTSSWSSKEW